MSWAHEMDLLDQLQGGEKSLFVVAQILHRDPDKRCHSTCLMLQDGVIGLFDQGHELVPAWRWKVVLHDESNWLEGTGYCLKLTPKGAKNIG